MTAVIPGAFTLSQPCALQDEPTDCFLGDPPAAAVAVAFELSAAQQGIGRILPDTQCLTYASTEAILQEGLCRSRLDLGRHEAISVYCGEILCLEAGHAISRERFDDAHLLRGCMFSPWQGAGWHQRAEDLCKDDPYLAALRSVAPSFGYTESDVALLTRQGFSPMEIEELFYCGEGYAQ